MCFNDNFHWNLKKIKLCLIFNIYAQVQEINKNSLSPHLECYPYSLPELSDYHLLHCFFHKPPKLCHRTN